MPLLLLRFRQILVIQRVSNPVSYARNLVTGRHVGRLPGTFVISNPRRRASITRRRCSQHPRYCAVAVRVESPITHAMPVPMPDMPAYHSPKVRGAEWTGHRGPCPLKGRRGPACCCCWLHRPDPGRPALHTPRLCRPMVHGEGKSGRVDMCVIRPPHEQQQRQARDAGGWGRRSGITYLPRGGKGKGPPPPPSPAPRGRAWYRVRGQRRACASEIGGQHARARAVPGQPRPWCVCNSSFQPSPAP